MSRSRPAQIVPPQAIFDALADPTRRQMIEQLTSGETVTITQLAAAHSMSRQAITKHLEVLENAGLIESERRGRERIIRFTPRPLNEASSWISEIGEKWDRRLATLRKFVTEHPDE
jgi:DNA-binding transcriptional ArsR family regulator